MSRYAIAIVAFLLAAIIGGFYAGRTYLAADTPKSTATEVYSSRPAGEKTTASVPPLQPAKPANNEAGSPTENEKKNTGENNGGDKKNQASNSPSLSLSNERHGWGIKRNDNHQQPEMPKAIRDTLARYDAYWIGSPEEKVLYLTFDEGYENGYTPKILDILKANNVKAAFFVTGHYLKTQPELVKRMVAEGHIVGNHTMNHPSLPEISDEEIRKELQSVEELFTSLTGKKMKYLRPPKGEYSERTLAVTRQLGYYNIFWSLALVDWVPMPGGPQEAYQSVMDNLHNGAVILLHAVSRDNTEALDRILKDARARGYTFKTLDDLVAKKA
ncbi:peptidoglycan-N-acetylmuramic acid deacetylase [Desulfofundulus australicus DSM 11792]|uniref:Peptidoglycan-N-acetylmuramic acid deacetylase n=1 Tax=Desulfofundulus australicus DSM 11792 TaxID=1121425 RepID=A0A1M4YVH4_9FIRM|nr:delta-lactam-biosynthetic de-N-acetylase [Desulfofundulus australicus]MDK2888858.1 peptidoglycan-N-acetylmuramic acid deacetylase [Thermoanaerobacter sp.]SHF09791.1 peptidoglycan-N-acetylmuramic acid deacetylase [Desulfofundulus australicus DSM 11792]